MNDDSMDTQGMQDCVERIRQGDSSGANELIQATCHRLEEMARKFLKRFPAVARREQAEDVLQNALIRLTRSLAAVKPASMREFYCLAATQIRRELLDMARHYRGPLGIGSNEDSVNGKPPEPVCHSDKLTEELDRWCEFHQAIEALPIAEREVVGLLIYHGWKQRQVAELFQVTEKTVHRWKETALKRLEAQLQA